MVFRTPKRIQCWACGFITKSQAGAICAWCGENGTHADVAARAGVRCTPYGASFTGPCVHSPRACIHPIVSTAGGFLAPMMCVRVGLVNP